jgi:hypothetical protein
MNDVLNSQGYTQAANSGHTGCHIASGRAYILIIDEFERPAVRVDCGDVGVGRR